MGGARLGYAVGIDWSEADANAGVHLLEHSRAIQLCRIVTPCERSIWYI